MNRPSVIFLGSKMGAVVALQELISRQWEVLYVVISKTIEHKWYGDIDLETVAKLNNIPIVSQSELPRNLSVDYIISYMYRHLVKDDVLRMAKRDAVNFHAAPLPEFGGWGTYNRAILEESDYFGCTCHHMKNGFDDGPILEIKKFPINSTDLTAFDLEILTQKHMVTLFIDVIQIMEDTSTKLPSINQDRRKSVYLSFDQMNQLKRVSIDSSKQEIQKIARAFWFPPYQGAYIDLNGLQIEIVPEIVKNQIAYTTGVNVLSDLNKFLIDYKKSKFN
jgi:methionyl-tRNA formyltransferase